MSLSVDYYDALEATTSIEDMTGGEPNRQTLRLLRDNDADIHRLCICNELNLDEPGDYCPSSSKGLGWLGHFAKKSTRLEEFSLYGSGDLDLLLDRFKESVGRFFDDIGKCNRMKKWTFMSINDLTEILHKLGPAMKNNNMTHWYLENCHLGVPEANFLFSIFQDSNNLVELCIIYDVFDDDSGHDLDDGVMAGCIPSLSACTGMRVLKLQGLNMSARSCAMLRGIFPQMAALYELDLSENSIDDDCAEDLVGGLAECKHLRSLSLESNMTSDSGLEHLIQGLPASVSMLNLGQNLVTLARQLPLLRFKNLDLSWNTLSTDGPRVIVSSLANPECCLEKLHLRSTNMGDKGVTILAESLLSNQRLATIDLEGSNITETGWNAFRTVLCDTTSISATHRSNHTLEYLGLRPHLIPQDVKTMLRLNLGKDKSLVAAKKILQAHRHLDMKPLLDRELDLLPHVVAWLERFAESRLDLKLSSIFEFARAMPMEVVDGVAGKKKGKKRRRNNA